MRGATSSFSEQAIKRKEIRNKHPKADFEIFIFINFECKKLLSSNVLFFIIKIRREPIIYEKLKAGDYFQQLLYF